MDEVIVDFFIAVGICSAAIKAGFEKVVNFVVGVECLSKFDVFMVGDDVMCKKFDFLIYNFVRDKVGLFASKCFVVEDFIVGLRVVVGVDMVCFIILCGSNIGVDFMGEGVSKVVNDFGVVKFVMLFFEGAETFAFDGL